MKARVGGRQCEVKGCGKRRKTRLCMEHMVLWHNSLELKDGERQVDTGRAYNDWLKRVEAGRPPEKKKDKSQILRG